MSDELILEPFYSENVGDGRSEYIHHFFNLFLPTTSGSYTVKLLGYEKYDFAFLMSEGSLVSTDWYTISYADGLDSFTQDNYVIFKITFTENPSEYKERQVFTVSKIFTFLPLRVKRRSYISYLAIRQACKYPIKTSKNPVTVSKAGGSLTCNIDITSSGYKNPSLYKLEYVDEYFSAPLFESKVDLSKTYDIGYHLGTKNWITLSYNLYNNILTSNVVQNKTVGDRETTSSFSAWIYPRYVSYENLVLKTYQYGEEYIGTKESQVFVGSYSGKYRQELTLSGDLGSLIVSSDSMWAQPYVEGTELIVDYAENTDTSERESTIRVASSKMPSIYVELKIKQASGDVLSRTCSVNYRLLNQIRTVRVTQTFEEVVDPVLNVYPKEILFDESGGSYNVSVTSNEDAGVITATPNVSWITATKDGLITAQPSDGTTREGIVTFAGSTGGLATLAVKQVSATGDIRVTLRIPSSNYEMITPPIFFNTTNGFAVIDWGDGTIVSVPHSYNRVGEKHTYKTPGTYTIKLTGYNIRKFGMTVMDPYHEEWKQCVVSVESLIFPDDTLPGGGSVEGLFYQCVNLSGNVMPWDDKIGDVSGTYMGCTSLSGSIPPWGSNIVKAESTYRDCSSLTSCSDELLLNPMPSRVYKHSTCVTGCIDNIRRHFNEDWGGLSSHSGNIEIVLKIPSNNYKITIPEISLRQDGYADIVWGDGSSERVDSTKYPVHIYASAGTYTLKITGSDISGFGETALLDSLDPWKECVIAVNSLKFPSNSSNVNVSGLFLLCENLEGSIPEWDNSITSATETYCYCSKLVGPIPPWTQNIVVANGTYRLCRNLEGSIPEWGGNIEDARFTYASCEKLTGPIPAWGPKINDTTSTYYECFGLTGTIPAWGNAILKTNSTYSGCAGLTGSVPEWTNNIIDAYDTYAECSGLTGSIPTWGDNMEQVYRAYYKCSGLTGAMPAWGPKIRQTFRTYYNCSGLSSCSDELLLDPMPGQVEEFGECVFGCSEDIRRYFTVAWGGTKNS